MPLTHSIYHSMFGFNTIQFVSLDKLLVLCLKHHPAITWYYDSMPKGNIPAIYLHPMIMDPHNAVLWYPCTSYMYLDKWLNFLSRWPGIALLVNPLAHDRHNMQTSPLLRRHWFHFRVSSTIRVAENERYYLSLDLPIDYFIKICTQATNNEINKLCIIGSLCWHTTGHRWNTRIKGK